MKRLCLQVVSTLLLVVIKQKLFVGGGHDDDDHSDSLPGWRERRVGGERDREKEMDKQRERETSIGHLPYTPQPGIKSTIWVCGLTGN